MKINGISYWIKDGKCEMLNLDEGLQILRIPAFMDKVNGEIIGYCGSIKKFVVEDGTPHYYVKNNCLISADGELVAGLESSVIPTDGSIKRIGNMAFLHKAPMHLVIPDGVQELGYRAFAESENLRSVYIPESVQEISSAFERCDNLTAVFYGGSREKWSALCKEKPINDHVGKWGVYCKTEGAGMRRMNIDSRHVCPVCGKTMFPEYDSYDICGICGWEDEAGAEEYPDEDVGANYCSLNDYRKKYLSRVAQNPDYTWDKEMEEKWKDK